MWQQKTNLGHSDRRQPADTTFAGLTIGQLARRTGVSAKAIRYYESVGLLPRPRRTANGYRRYGPADVNRLLLLRRIRLLGVSLAVARPLLADTSDARCADVRRKLLALVDERIAAIDREITELRTLRAEVKRYRRLLAATSFNENERFDACSDMCCVAPSSGTASQEENDVRSAML
jgi:MerR family copper efflux transcriptional regulator